MNGSFVLQGLLIVFGTVLVRSFFPSRLVYRIALALLVIAGMGVLEVGVAPEDVNLRLHLLGAVANFLGGNLAMILLGLVMIRRSVCEALPSRFRSWITFALGSIGLLATLPWPSAEPHRGPHWDGIQARWNGWQSIHCLCGLRGPAS